MNEMIEYLKIHKVSLEQDLEKINYVNDHHFWCLKQAEIKNTEHLLSVAQDILDKEEEN